MLLIGTKKRQTNNQSIFDTSRLDTSRLYYQIYYKNLLVPLQHRKRKYLPRCCVENLKDACYDLTSEYSVYADLPGWVASTSPPSTLPSSISSSSFRPDLVVPNSEEVIILELTICAKKQANFFEAKSRNLTCGLHVTFDTLEVGSIPRMPLRP